MLTSRPMALLAGWALGCGEPDDKPPLDADGDHWVYWADCDDTDPAIHPHAVEICDGVDNNCDGVVDEADAADGTIWYYDADGDGHGDPAASVSMCAPPPGYVVEGDDCNDNNPDIRPGGVEVCDAVDNDCDGDIDEEGALGPSSFYADADADGFGDPSQLVMACTAPVGHVSDDSDCDDTRADVNPDAAEICDAFDVDEDCDGLADDEDSDASGTFTWFEDADLDTYGSDDPTRTTEACEQPAGYADDALDCDDTLRTVNPDATEVCGNEQDDDCDGAVDFDDPDAVPVDWFIDADGDGYGDDDGGLGRSCLPLSGAVTLDGDCDDTDASIFPGAADAWYDGVDSDCDGAGDYDADGDGYDASTFGGGDCDDLDVDVSPAAVEICGDGLDNDCSGVVDGCAVDAAIWGAAAGDRAGVAVAGGYDVTGDGVDDLIIGADREDAGGAGAGAVYVVSGLVSADGDLASLSTSKLVGEALGDHAGISVASPGDLDGDGYADVLVGAYGADAGGSGAGAAYVVSGPVSGEQALADARALLIGEQAGDAAGFRVAAAGDFGGDGVADLLVSATDESTAGANAGAVYLFEGPVSGNLRLWTADVKLTGEQAGDELGWGLARAGDVNADGLDDIIVGAPMEHTSGVYRGAAYLILGGAGGTFGLEEADAKLTGGAAGDLAGHSVGGGADANGDGYADLLIGAPEEDAGGSGAGAAYLVLGPLSGEHSLSTADTTFVGENNDDLAGSAVSFLDDIDADGQPDVAVGARLDDVAGSDAGAVYILLDLPAGVVDLSEADAKVLGASAGDWVGSTLSPAGDLDGDGAADFVIGVPYDDVFDVDAGAVWVVLGGGL